MEYSIFKLVSLSVSHRCRMQGKAAIGCRVKEAPLVLSARVVACHGYGVFNIQNGKSFYFFDWIVKSLLILK